MQTDELEHKRGLIEIHVDAMRLRIQAIEEFGKLYAPTHYFSEVKERLRKVEQLSQEIGDVPPPILRDAYRALGMRDQHITSESGSLDAFRGSRVTTLALDFQSIGDGSLKPLSEGEPFACTFRLSAPRRSSGGSFVSPWSDLGLQKIRSSLRYQQGPSSPLLLSSAGQDLRKALAAIPDLEGAIAHFNEAEKRRLVVRALDERVFRLPWELLQLTRGQAVQPFVLRPASSLERCFPLRESHRRPSDEAFHQGTVLYGWSAAGGVVPNESHRTTLEAICGEADVPLQCAESASLRLLADSAQEASERGRPVRILHLLCHGKRLPGETEVWGLALDGPGQGAQAVTPGQLATFIEHDLPDLVLLSLHACDGANPGEPQPAGEAPNFLGSSGEAAYGVGISVVASQFPLTIPGSKIAVETFFSRLLVDRGSVGEALERTVAVLHRDMGSDSHDWASLVLLRPDPPE